MKKFPKPTTLLLLIFGLINDFHCASEGGFDTVPDWAADVVWYQIFPERFRNGDPGNDPTIETLDGTWPYEKQTEWAITPWTSDWYKLQPWEKGNGRGFYYNAQLRRYGGDIQGIIDKLDYLQELGVNALYLNPVFESASSHKYGATMYHHIDNNFGPDPEGDIKIWNLETPDDPATWRWTAADRLFLKLIDEVHQRDMKIIIDGVFNHVGIPFWAFQDVKQKGKKSKYLDWFIIKSFDNPHTKKDEFDYQGWYGVMDLPEIRENKNGPCDSFREHIQAVVHRWMDPNGDGNPEDGIDGWRLDVAEMVSKEFWRDFRRWVRGINPEAYLTGEIWWENFSENIMFDASPWLQGDIFDAVMNYRFADAMLKACVDKKMQIRPTQLDNLLGFVRRKYPQPNQQVLMNLMGSHDTERFASMVINPDRWIDHASNLNYDEEFEIRKPMEEEREVQKLILAFQFCYPGAPYIYYGDEVGMWGADDPDCRKPMVWEDYQYEPETHHPFGQPRPVDSVEVNRDLLEYYRQLIRIRKDHPALRRGEYETVYTVDDSQIFVFERSYRSDKIRVAFNFSEEIQSVPVEKCLGDDQESWRLIHGEIRDFAAIPPKSFGIYKRGND